MSFTPYQEQLIRRQMQGGAGYNVLDDDEFLKTLGEPNDPFDADMSFTPFQEQLIQRQMEKGAGYNVFEDQEFLDTLNPPDQPEGIGENFVRRGSDLAQSFGVGSNALLTGIGGLYGIFTGDYDNWAVTQGRRGIEYYQGNKSPELIQKERDFQAYVDEGTGELDKLRRAFWGTVSDPELLANTLVQTTPSLVAPGGVGVGTLRAGLSKTAATVAGSATGVGLQAGSIGGDVYSDVKATPQEILEGNPQFVQRANEIGQEAALEELALDASRKAAGISAAISAASMGAIPNTVEKALTRGIGGNPLTRGLKGGLAEGLQEAVEEGGGQFAANVGVRDADPTRGLFEGTGQAAAVGGLAGFGIGGLLGSVSQDARNQSAQQGGDNLDQAGSAAGATADALDSLRTRMGIQSPPIVDGTINLDGQPRPQDPPLPDAQFEPDSLTNPANPSESGVPIPELPFDLRDEILFAERMGRAQQATSLRTAQQLYNLARQTPDPDAAQRFIDRANELVGRELPDEFVRLSPEPAPGPVVANQRQPRLEYRDDIIQPAPDYDTLFAGSRGQGFKTQKGAEVALTARQKAQPEFDWTITPANGRYVLTGKRRERGPQTPLDQQLDNRRERESFDFRYENEPVDRPRAALAEYYQLGDTGALEMELERVQDEIEALETAPVSRGFKRPNETDLLNAIANLGGINAAAAVEEDFDPASFTGTGEKRPFRINGGRSFDDMGEQLTEYGWFQERPTANEVVDLVRTAVNSPERFYMGEGRRKLTELEAQADAIEAEIRFIEEEFGFITDDERVFLEYFYEESLNAIYGQEETPQAGGEAGDQEAGPPTPDETLGGAPQARIGEEIDTAPQGAVSDSGAPEFALTSYTEDDIADLENRDLEAGETQAQIDRERERFALDASKESIEATNQPQENTDLFGDSVKDAAPQDLPTAQELLDRVGQIDVASASASDLDAIAKTLKIAKKKKGETIEQRRARIAATVDGIQRLQDNAAAMAQGSLTKKQLLELAEASDSKVGKSRAKQLIAGQLLTRLNDLGKNYTEAVDRQSIKNKLSRQKQNKEPISVKEFEAMLGGANRVMGQGAYTEGDYDVAVMLGHDTLLPRGQRENEAAYELNDQYVNSYSRGEALQFLAEKGVLNTPEWDAFLDSMVKNSGASLGVRGMLSREAFENLNIGVPATEENIDGLYSELGEDPVYRKKVEDRKAGERSDRAAMTPQDQIWKSFLISNHRYLVDGDVETSGDIREREYSLTIKDEFALPEGIPRKITGSRSVVSNALRLTNRLNQLDPNKKYRPLRENQVEIPPRGNYEAGTAVKDEYISQTLGQDYWVRDIFKDGKLFSRVGHTGDKNVGVHVVDRLDGKPPVKFYSEKTALVFAMRSESLEESELAYDAVAEEPRPQRPADPPTEVANDQEAISALQEQWMDFLRDQVNDKYSRLFASQGIYNLFDYVENMDEYPRPINEWDSSYFIDLGDQYDNIKSREESRDVKFLDTRTKGAPLDPNNANIRVVPSDDSLYDEVQENVPYVPWKDRLDETFESADQFGTQLIDILFTPPVERFNYQSKFLAPVISDEQAAQKREDWKENAAKQGRENLVAPDGKRNADRMVVSLFDKSGEWSKPWKEAGYQVMQVDIQEGVDIEDMLTLQYWRQFIDNGTEVYAVLAAPPCTFLTATNNRTWPDADVDGRTRESQEVLFKTTAVIEYLKPTIWAIENPANGRVGLTITGSQINSKSSRPVLTNAGGFPAPTFNFEKRTFGDLGVKPTSIWGNVNPVMPTARISSTAEDGDLNSVGGKTLEAMNKRSETPEGFAYAFFNANNAIDNFNNNDHTPWRKQWMALMYPGTGVKSMHEAMDAGFTNEQIAQAVDNSYEYDQDSINDAYEADIAELMSGEPDGKPALFQAARGATRTRTMTDEVFDETVNAIMGDKAGDLEVVQSVEDLPEAIRESATQQLDKGLRIRGVYHLGKVYIVKDNIDTKSQLERALLHEGTHGGIRAMYKDEGVNKALNRVWAAMGGQKGFDKVAAELGLTESLGPYKRGLKNGKYDQETRNRIMVEEMLAYQGQTGSKTLKTRILELIGAIREWLRKNGFARLATFGASDIANMARTAREDYFRSGSSTETDAPSFATEGTRRRAEKSDLGLYSNAEQVLLDEGDKIFKPSKKNPEGRVRGDQILSFLKGRGLKPEEARYTEIETFLTAEPGRKFTRDEVIRELQLEAPVFEEFVAGITSKPTSEDFSLYWSEPEPQDDVSHYEWRIEDLESEMRTTDSGYEENYALKQILSDFYFDKPNYDSIIESAIENLDIVGDDWATLDAKSGFNAVRWLQKTYGIDDLTNAVKRDHEIELETGIAAYAMREYKANPVLRMELLSNRYVDTKYISVSIQGNDDLGYVVQINPSTGTPETLSDIWAINEAQLQAQEWLRDSGYLEPRGPEGLEVYEAFPDIAGEEWNQYREIKMTTEGKWGTYGSYAGHFREENVLYNVIATDRDTVLGNTLVGEEFQSDWHSDIRKAGGPRDPERIAAAKLEKVRLEEEVDRAEDQFDELKAQIEDAFKTLPDANEDAGRGPLWAVLQSLMIQTGDNVIALDKVLTDAGRSRFRSTRKQTDSSHPDILTSSVARRLLSGLYPFEIQRYFDKDALYDRFGPYLSSIFEELDGYELADIAALREATANYKLLMTRIEQAGAKELAYKFEDARRKQGIFLTDARTAELNVWRAQKAPPEAPYGDDKYLELVIKRMLITAVEEGKDAIAWSTARRLNARWMSNYNYTPQYEQKVPKIVKKLTGADLVKMDENGELVDPDAKDWDGKPVGEFWGASISDELKQDITENGLSMFQAEDDRIYPREPIEETMRDMFLRKIQDKFLPVKRVQERIEADVGRLDESMDPYAAEELFYGKTEEDLRQMEVRFVKPLISALKRSGITIEQLDLYLYARHAEERNRAIAEKRANLPEGMEMPDGGSGMTNAEAQEIIGIVESSDQAQQFMDLANRVYQMTEFTRELLVNGGLVTPETVGSWMSEYENYVPLKGWAEGENDSNGNRVPPRARTGQGFDIRGKEAIPALGRSSKAASPTAQVVADLTEKVIRFRKNEVGQKLLALVEAYPDMEQWQVFTDENPDKRVMNGADGQAVMGAVDMGRDKDNYLAVKRDGKNYYIKMEDRRLFEAMRNLGPEPLNLALRALNPITRFLSSVNTSLNPQFVVSNFTRDIQAAALNLAAEATRVDGKLDGESITASVVKGTPKAIGAILSANFESPVTLRDSVDDAVDPDASEYRRFYQEFLDDGAKTGYFDSPEVDKIAKDMESALQMAGPGAWPAVKSAFKNLGDWVDRINSAVENGVRLSSYIEARKAGLAREKAASLAKNLTVNFNRKGELGAALNSVYMFFNAAVQGTLGQFARTVAYRPRKPDGSTSFNPRDLNKAQKIMAGIVVAAYGLASWNRGVGGEDDDGEDFYDKIPQGIRERNLIVMKPWSMRVGDDGRLDPNSYYKFPLPYGYNFFFNLGDTIEAQVNGSPDRLKNLWGNLVGSFVTSFSPLPLHAGENAVERGAMTLAPSVAVPALEIGFNVNYFGEQIAPENFPGPYSPKKADAELYYQSVKDPYRFISKLLNEATGGSRNKSGIIDISPESLEHIMESALGGIYRTGIGTYDTIARPLSGREVQMPSVPFARILVGRDGSDYSDMDKFYDNRQEVVNARDEYRKAETDEERQASDAQFNGQRRMFPRARAVDKQLRNLRDRQDRIRDDDSLTPREKELKLEAIRVRMDDLVDRFNKQYDEFMQSPRRGGGF